MQRNREGEGGGKGERDRGKDGDRPLQMNRSRDPLSTVGQKRPQSSSWGLLDENNPGKSAKLFSRISKRDTLAPRKSVLLIGEGDLTYAWTLLDYKSAKEIHIRYPL